MDTNRFDTVARLFASRRTRRSAILTGAGLTAAAAVAPLMAQEATPASDASDPHSSADTAARNPEFLFVQPFAGGTWAPKEGDDQVYTLTLSGAAANTVYFSDRPERIFGLAPTGEFLDGLGFSPDNPPNAAVVTKQEGSDEQEVLLIELLNPAFDGETLTYDARVLADYGEYGLAHAARQQQGYELGETFGEGGLFIDDCSDGSGECYTVINGVNTNVGSITIGNCYHFPKCRPCNDDGTSAQYGKACAAQYPDQCNYSDSGWDCFVSF